ncbi:MAG: hypothetical protein TREMPRED_005871 [Tremellales sp. Tagirdzhanova-0007]|nr:MAG: hypothetical protein TREMPRED_005871 [Tremellales sp. Tagirdzhanova-0007]
MSSANIKAELVALHRDYEDLNKAARASILFDDLEARHEAKERALEEEITRLRRLLFINAPSVRAVRAAFDPVEEPPRPRNLILKSSLLGFMPSFEVIEEN